MKVFLDTNVLLDFLMQRNDCAAAKKILALPIMDNDYELLVSDLTIANACYITRKQIRQDFFYETISRLLRFFRVIPIGPQAVSDALALQAKDFEDALQYFSAINAGADVIITRNIKDFPFSTLPIYEPDQFLKLTGQ